MGNIAITEMKAKATGPRAVSGRMRSALNMNLRLSRIGVKVALVGVDDLV